MDEQLFLLFFTISGAALVPFLARKLRIPSAAFEIILGVVIFNTFVSHPPEWFSLLKEIGIIYLMFIAGMELDLRALIKQRGDLMTYFLIPVLSFSITPLIFVLLGYSFYLGIAISVISAGIIIPVLKETGIIRSDLGRAIIRVALTGELISIAVLTGIDVYHNYGLTIMAGMEIFKLVVLLFVAAGFLKVLYVTAWWNPQWVQKIMESEDPVEEGIRAVIAIAFAGALLAHYAGVESILGSFIAGVVFSYVFRSKGRFEEKINAVGFGFFTPFFFIGVGASFDITILTSPESVAFALFMTSMVFISNIYPLVFRRSMKLSMRESISMSLLLSSPLSMIVVAGTLGLKMGLIAPATNSSLILAALISALLFPSLFRIFNTKLACD
jgi:Kef-type K+ transport system membrane component KefB